MLIRGNITCIFFARVVCVRISGNMQQIFGHGSSPRVYNSIYNSRYAADIWIRALAVCVHCGGLQINCRKTARRPQMSFALLTCLRPKVSLEGLVEGDLSTCGSDVYHVIHCAWLSLGHDHGLTSLRNQTKILE